MAFLLRPPPSPHPPPWCNSPTRAQGSLIARAARSQDGLSAVQNDRECEGGGRKLFEGQLTVCRAFVKY